MKELDKYNNSFDRALKPSLLRVGGGSKWSLFLSLVFISVFGFMPSLLVAQSHKTDEHAFQRVDIRIYFRYDDDFIDSTYMSNRETLHLVDSLLRDQAIVSGLERVEVAALSSPEGTYDYNTRLSARRQAALERYLKPLYPNVTDEQWHFTAMAENWVEFREMILDDEQIPSKDRVMSIVDSDEHVDRKEWLLRILDYGEPWRHIQERILPRQRYGASFVFVPMRTLFEPVSGAYARFDDRFYTTELKPVATTLTPEREALIALKTNMVWDLASVVNIGVEVPIGDRFSVVGEVVWPWWRSWEHNLTMQIESYHAEVKYWLGDRSTRERLTGWNAGVYGGWGLYDVQLFSETGTQGDFFDVGAQIGYAHKLWRNLHIEYTLGLGYLSTDYNDYFMAYDIEEFGDAKVIPFPWMNHNLSTLLPTRCGVSLVWHINPKWRGGAIW